MSKKIFDYACFNPPYQQRSNTSEKPIYNEFMAAAYTIADIVEAITPARFLFNVGKTPKEWNEKMLNDEHFKVLHYEPSSKEVFPNTNIKGGVVITLHNCNKKYKPIIEFIENEILRNIVGKIKNKEEKCISEIHFNRSSYKFTDTLYKENTKLVGRMKKNERYAFTSNIFDKMPEVFFEQMPNDCKQYVQLYGLANNIRTYKWIRKEYIEEHDNLNKWKVFVAKSNGTGRFGEVLSNLEVAKPGSLCTQTFISFGNFDDKDSCIALSKYLKTKFCRALLGACKITPENARKEVWKYVPLQDFSNNSDIDWSKSNIDQQLYKKYNLTNEEIDFIETHVKEMK